MSLIEVSLTEDYNIIPNIDQYINRNIHDKTIYCDLSGTSLTDNSFNLRLTLTGNENNVQKFNVLFRNNSNDPIITKLYITNTDTPILFNNRDSSGINYTMNNQEFILQYNSNGTYNAISSIRKYH